MRVAKQNRRSLGQSNYQAAARTKLAVVVLLVLASCGPNDPPDHWRSLGDHYYIDTSRIQENDPLVTIWLRKQERSLLADVEATISRHEINCLDRTSRLVANAELVGGEMMPEHEPVFLGHNNYIERLDSPLGRAFEYVCGRSTGLKGQ